MSERSTTEIMDREFLELRAKILELAASFDRLNRASGSEDPRNKKIIDGLAILSDNQAGKAERVQLLFSRDYSPEWRSELGL